MKKLLQLGFVPKSADFALLVLRVWLGLTLLLNHGLAKALHRAQTVAMFRSMAFNPLGVGIKGTVALVIFAEVVCAAALVIGAATRLAALIIAIQMSVAFFIFHHALIGGGPMSGELAFMYLGGAVTIFLAGGGRYSLCCKMCDKTCEAPAKTP